MEDYKRRMAREYQELHARYLKLKDITTKYEAAGDMCVEPEEYLGFKPNTTLTLLKEQQYAMGQYLHCLEKRAVIEDVNLEWDNLYTENVSN